MVGLAMMQGRDTVQALLLRSLVIGIGLRQSLNQAADMAQDAKQGLLAKWGTVASAAPISSACRQIAVGDKRPTTVNITVKAPNAANPTPGSSFNAAMPTSFTTDTSTPNKNTGTMHHGRNCPMKRTQKRKPGGSRPAHR